MLRMSWSKTFFPASLAALMANATVASRYIPSGTMPMTAPTMETMPSCQDSPFTHTVW